jgi:hypothetical protein
MKIWHSTRKLERYDPGLYLRQYFKVATPADGYEHDIANKFFEIGGRKMRFYVANSANR